MQAQVSPGQSSSLRTRLGVLTLLLLCAIQFMDVADSKNAVVTLLKEGMCDQLHRTSRPLVRRAEARP